VDNRIYQKVVTGEGLDEFKSPAKLEDIEIDEDISEKVIKRHNR
jgi:hypothetical protein